MIRLNRLPRRVTLASLLAIGLSSLVLRYPEGHELGVDSFAIHTLAQSIDSVGRAVWTLNPLSYFGWYPASYPSGGPFLLAAIAPLSGVQMEEAILLETAVLGLIGVLSSFVMAMEFNRHAPFAIAVAFTYSLAPRFLDFTLWQASTRNLFMAVFPLFIWAILRLYRERNLRSGLFFVGSLFVLAASHRLVVLAIVVAAAFLFAIVLFEAYRILQRTRPGLVMRSAQRGITRWGALSAAAATAAGFIVATGVLSDYSTGELANGTSLQVELLNLSVSITRSVGLAAPLALIGLLYSPWLRAPNIRQAFAVLGLVTLVPTLLFRDYTGFYILPFLALFSGYALQALGKRLEHRHRLRTSAYAVVVAAFIVTSGGILGYEVVHSPPLSPATYTAATYLRYASDGATIVCNEPITCSRLAALGGFRMIPTAVGSFGHPSPEVIIFGFYNQSEILSSIVPVALANLSINSDSLWSVVGLNPSEDYIRIVQSPVGSIPQSLQTRYNISYYLETNSGFGIYFDEQGTPLPSPFGRSAHMSAYLVYADGTERVWFTGQPE